MCEITGACLILTTNCNLECPMCYSFRGESSIDYLVRKKIIDSLKRSRLQKISFGGGEPLLADDLPETLSYAKSNGFKTALCTNGMLLSVKLVKEFEPFLDEITLPIDGSTFYINSLHRGNTYDLDHILLLIDIVQASKIQLDISTVLTSRNLDDLPDLISLIRSKKVKKWKIFQFYALGRGGRNSVYFHLSHEDFTACRKRILSECGSEIDLDFRSDDEKEMKSYLNISPQGNILIVNGEKYMNIGCCFECNDLMSILKDNDFNFDFHKMRHRRDIPSNMQG